MFVSILIVNHDAAAQLRRCLACLAAQTYVNFEVLVMTDDKDKVPLPDGRFRYLETDLNLGSARGYNWAAASAKGAWLALLHSTTYAEPDWLMILMQATRRHPACPVFGSTPIKDQDPSLLESCGTSYDFMGFPWASGTDWLIEWVPDEGSVFSPSAGSAFYRKDIFLQLGGLDERFFTLGEEFDLAFRLRLQGYEPVQIPEAIVRHEALPFRGETGSSSLFYVTRNRIWVLVKNMPTLLLCVVLPFHILANLLLLLDLSTVPLRWQGMRAALDGLPDMWKTRQQVQATRTVSSLKIAKALSWSPRHIFWRMADVRKIEWNR